MIFDPAEAMSVDERATVQTRRLRGMVDRLLAVDGGLQGERLRAAGVTSGAELTLDDLASLPTVSKTDLWDAYPFGMLAVPVRGVRRGTWVLRYQRAADDGGVHLARHRRCGHTWSRVAWSVPVPPAGRSSTTHTGTGCSPVASVSITARGRSARPWYRCPVARPPANSG